jgi:hypothetical protein
MIAVSLGCYHATMKQIITRVDDELADGLKRRAQRSGESVNTFVSRLLRLALAAEASAPSSPRQLWKASAIADGRLVGRSARSVGEHQGALSYVKVTTPAGYMSDLVSQERDER